MKLNRSTTRLVVLTVAAVFALTLAVPLASYAGSEGRRNTAIGLAGVAAYLAIKGKTLPALASAAGAYYSYDRYKDAREDEKYRDRYWNRDRYGRNRDRDYRHDNGKHKGWERGKHKGWDNHAKNHARRR